MSGATFKGRKVNVELTNDSGAAAPRKGKGSRPASSAEHRHAEKDGGRRGRQRQPEKPAREKKAKPSREERGYTKARGRKDDWKQFFIHDEGEKSQK